MINRPANLDISVQTSRFHTENVADGTSRDINVAGLNITIGAKPLLVDATLKIFKGVHYGLIGANGVGKSFLLKSIAYNWIPGLKPNAFYMAQIEDPETLKKPAIEAVIFSNSQYDEIYREIDLLEETLELKSESRIRSIFYGIEKAKLAKELNAARMHAAKTSNARGAVARRVVNDLELQLQNFQISDDGEPIQSVVQQRLQVLYGKVPDKQLMKSKAERILKQLKFNDVNKPINELSGGWRLRVSLAMAMFCDPELLLLDEPTNHLDLPAIVWLIDYIQTELSDVTIITVSHDRNLLNMVCDEIIVMQQERLTVHDGNYDEYMANQMEAKKHRENMRDAIDRKREKIQQSISTGISQAKKSKDDKKLKQMASKQLKLDERLGMEKNEKGHRFKLNRDRIGYFFERRADVENEFHERTGLFKILEPNLLTQHSALLQVDSIWFQYRSDSEVILKNVTISVEYGSRHAIIGPNGFGKSTLLHILSETLTPTRGKVVRHPQAKIGYFEQHMVENLQSESLSALEYISKHFKEKAEQEIYTHLGSFGLRGDVARQPLKTLSGGQRVRFVFAFMLVQGSPQLMLLDEPTNHLDINAIESLIESLLNYAGAIVFVSHDLYFLKRMMESEGVDHDKCHVWAVGNKKVELMQSIDAYVTSDVHR